MPHLPHTLWLRAQCGGAFSHRIEQTLIPPNTYANQCRLARCCTKLPLTAPSKLTAMLKKGKQESIVLHGVKSTTNWQEEQERAANPMFSSSLHPPHIAPFLCSFPSRVHILLSSFCPGAVHVQLPLSLPKLRLPERAPHHGPPQLPTPQLPPPFLASPT